MPTSREFLTAGEEATIKEALRQCRRAMVTLQMHSNRRTMVWREATALMLQIDDVAMVFLGDRTIFHEKGALGRPPHPHPNSTLPTR